MYIFELMYKIGQKIKEINQPKMKKEDAEEEVCDHIYLPVDSTKEILACTKCGMIIRAKDIINNDNV